jgi:uncharacterized protein (TIGR00369 family)
MSAETALRELLDDARRRGDLEPLLAAIPYLRFLGLHATVLEGDLIVHMPGSQHLIGNPVLPALHGGTVGALLESTAILKLLWESDSIGVPKTITLTIDYLRSGRLIDTQARAVITRLGRRVANVQVHAWQADEARPIAVGHAHFLLRSPESRDPA